MAETQVEAIEAESITEGRALVPGREWRSRGRSFPVDVAVSVEPKASSKWLISLAVAVVEAKSVEGCAS